MGLGKNMLCNGSSGGGSEIEYNINAYNSFINEFVRNDDIKFLFDLACGSGKLRVPIFHVHSHCFASFFHLHLHCFSIF